MLSTNLMTPAFKGKMTFDYTYTEHDGKKTEHSSTVSTPAKGDVKEISRLLTDNDKFHISARNLELYSPAGNIKYNKADGSLTLTKRPFYLTTLTRMVGEKEIKALPGGKEFYTFVVSLILKSVDSRMETVDISGALKESINNMQINQFEIKER